MIHEPWLTIGRVAFAILAVLAIVQAVRKARR